MFTANFVGVQWSAFVGTTFCLFFSGNSCFVLIHTAEAVLCFIGARGDLIAASLRASTRGLNLLPVSWLHQSCCSFRAEFSIKCNKTIHSSRDDRQLL